MKIVDQNILLIIQYLKIQKVIRYDTQACKSIGMVKQTLANIVKGTQYFTVQHIANFCDAYNVNIKCVFGTESNVFNTPKSIDLAALSLACKTAIQSATIDEKKTKKMPDKKSKTPVN